MAATSVILDIRANTSKALGEFKRFSAQLDNKFLISGLKLDVVRSALSQINREFQKAIGEQGLAAGSSLKAAENQAALLTQTFKGFSSEAAKNITKDISAALNQVAVTAGGTMEDVKKTISATPFISTSLPEEIRKKMGEGILSFQRDIRRAGISDEFGNFAQQFLSGQAGALDLINSGKPLESFLGAQIAQRAGTVGQIYDPKQRTDILKSIIEDPALQTQLRELALETSGYKIFLEDLNTALFNPRAGVFGSLREVAMGIGDKTNVFRETNSLVESIFGRQGLFVNFFKQIGKIFGIEDPLKVVISGIRFLTRQFNALNQFVQSPAVQGIVNGIRDVFNRIKSFSEGLYKQVIEDFEDPQSLIGRVRGIAESVGGFFSGIYETVKGGEWQPDKINESIRGIGASVREFVKGLGETIRGEDVSDEARFGSSILGTLVSEIGKTAVTVFAELGKTIVNKVPEIAALVIPALASAIVDAIKSSFEQGPLEGAIAAALAGGAGIFALRKLGGVLGAGRTGLNAFLEGGRNQQTGGRAGQANRFFGSPFGPTLGRGTPVGAAASDLGSSSVFYRQVIFYLSRITNCVCGVGGLSGAAPNIDIDGSPRGRSTVSSLGYAGPRRQPAYASPIGPLPDVRSSYLSSRREATRNILGRGSSSVAMERYAESLRGPFSDLDDDRRGLMAAEVSEREGRRVADRYNRRFGRRARFGRAFRGLGKGALIAGAIGLGSAALLGGGDAQAAEMGGEAPAMGAGQAFGNVAMGAAEGALTGAMFGPWGAAIGGVLGAGIALMDKGTREAAGKWVSNLMGSIGKFSSDFIGSTGKFVKGITEGIGKAAQGVIKFFVTDLPGLWLSGVKALYIDIPKKLLDFGVELGKSMLDSVSNFNLGDVLKNTWEAIKSGVTGGSRAPGGNTYAGRIYKVGEHGEELFSPTANGTITNNATLNNLLSSGRQASSSVSATFNVSINVNGGMSPGDVENLRGPVLQIIEQAWQQASTGTTSRGSTIL